MIYKTNRKLAQQNEGAEKGMQGRDTEKGVRTEKKRHKEHEERKGIQEDTGTGKENTMNRIEA